MSDTGKEKLPIAASVDRTKSEEELVSIFWSIRGSLIRFASRYIRKSPQDIEDVVQDAFVKVLEAQRQREIKSPKAYFFKTTRNLALNEIDRSANRLTDALGEMLAETVVSDEPTVEEQVESRQRFEFFCQAVRRLPPKRRRVFVLRRVYGLTHKEISERMNISVKTVEAHLTKAMVECLEHMAAIEADPRERSINKRDKQKNG